jgi:hypothetical protein
MSLGSRFRPLPFRNACSEFEPQKGTPSRIRTRGLPKVCCLKLVGSSVWAAILKMGVVARMPANPKTRHDFTQLMSLA